MTKVSNLRPFIPAILWALAILALSTGANIQMPGIIFSPDKVGHFVAYGILALLWMLAFKSRGQSSWQLALFVTLGATAYGTCLEFVQWAFYPNRFFEVWDMAANCAGALAFAVLFRFFTTQK